MMRFKRARLLLLCALFLAGARAEAAPSFKGVWWTAIHTPHVKPVDGGIPFTPKGEAAYRTNVEGLKAGTLQDRTKTLCLPEGLPRLMLAPYPFEIVQTDKEVVFIHESNHVVRLVELKKPMTPDDELIESFMGESIGRWDGDVLVVETHGIKTDTWLDASGVPHGPKLRVAERIRLIDGGKRLENILTVSDPDYFTKDFSVRTVFERRDDVTIEEHYCGKAMRDISSVKGAVP